MNKTGTYYASSHTVKIEHPFFKVLGCTHALEFRICKGFMDYAPCSEVSWDCNSRVSTDSIVSHMPYTKITQLSLHSTLCTPAFPGDLSYGTRLGCFIIISQLKKCLTLYLKCNSQTMKYYGRLNNGIFETVSYVAHSGIKVFMNVRIILIQKIELRASWLLGKPY